MPIYEYECNDCGHKLEAIQKFSDDPLRDCPDCAEGELRKLVSAVGFRLKGSGWYETDFKSGNKRNVVDSAKQPTSGKESSASAGSGSSCGCATASD